MPVNFKHPDLCLVEPDIELIGDCIAGQRAIKKAGEKYLPRPNPGDTSPENGERYKAYKQRAVFHNFTARTGLNMVGQCFAVDPVATVPDSMDAWLDDIDGAGVTINQQSKQALAYNINFSRAGLWVDYPKTSGPVSQLDAEKGGIRPKMLLFHPLQIINWRTVQKGSRTLLSLIVIKESYVDEDDGFEPKRKVQYRALRLINGIYQIEVYRDTGGEQWGLVPSESVTPLRGDGKTWDEIPFIFIGAEANDSNVEKPLMLDVANLNVAHYRNSADYEELVYLCGQPTFTVSGLTQQWIDANMPGPVLVGSRVGLKLPAGGKAEMVQVQSNTLPYEAMTQKEEQAKQLGAKLVAKSEVAKTATESGINEASESSILASCCKNVSAAYSTGLRWFAIYANVTTSKPEEEILYELNTEFAVSRMTPEEATAVMGLFNGTLITFEEARDKLKSGGIGYLDDQDAKDQLDAQAEADFAQAQKDMQLQTDSQVAVVAAKGAVGGVPPAKKAAKKVPTKTAKKAAKA